MSVELRLMELETRVAFQDDALMTMSDEIARQQRDIERLQLQLAALARRQEDLAGQVGEPLGDEPPPPHY
ncbi:SlyX protein [Pseudomonas fluvialis]|uniref:Protein SlyX homolog n=1 Tax=Pseudomonas fluvialis TaxID=1793966 RepID=A0A7X0BSJ6_9PSED|nr:SlyX family protein [Pseudomonas fluvialis]MBB6342084.1 SlyX protein [Pseudomonas fluvialis]